MPRLAFIVLAAMLVGCGGTETKTVVQTVTETTTVTEEAAPTETTATEPAPASDDIGKVKTSGGITLRVLNVRKSSRVTYEGGVQSDDTPDGNARTVKAKQGGRYVFVKTRLKNNMSGGIDLTCGFPVDAKLIDEDGRSFDPIKGISQIRGNPGCNDMLQPGFRTQMTWVFLVPPETQLSAFSFAAVDENLDTAEATEVALR